MQKIGIKCISKTSSFWELRNLEDIYLLENQVDVEAFSKNFFIIFMLYLWNYVLLCSKQNSISKKAKSN